MAEFAAARETYMAKLASGANDRRHEFAEVAEALADDRLDDRPIEPVVLVNRQIAESDHAFQAIRQIR